MIGPSFRKKTVTKIISVVTVSILCLLMVFILVPRENGSHLPESSSDFFYIKIDPPKEASNFTLADQFGNEVSLSDFRDNIVILVFYYTRCAHACPAGAYVTAQVQTLAKEQAPGVAADLVVLAVTVDPNSDTQENRRNFVESFVEPYEGGMLFLGGDNDAVAPIWNAYDIEVEKTTISEYVSNVGITENDLLREIEEDLGNPPHVDYPGQLKEDILEKVHAVFVDDYLILHTDITYIIKDGLLRFKILGHDINPQNFVELLSYVWTSA